MPVLFPGGDDEIQSSGRKIAALLDNRIPADAGARIYASTKYLAHTAEDKSKPRVVAYIIRQGMGRISDEEASLIYDQLILSSSRPVEHSVASQPREEHGTLYVDSRLADKRYLLRSATRSVPVNAMVLTTLFLGLRSNGWNGASHLFAPGGVMMKSLSGTYSIGPRDAREIAALLRSLPTASRGLSPAMDETVDAHIALGNEGAFEIST
jgi:hypothetical protein